MYGRKRSLLGSRGSFSAWPDDDDDNDHDGDVTDDARTDYYDGGTDDGTDYCIDILYGAGTADDYIHIPVFLPESDAWMLSRVTKRLNKLNFKGLWCQEPQSATPSPQLLSGFA